MRLWDNAAALKRLYRWLYACVILCLLAAGGVWLVNSPYFPIKQVQLAQPLVRVSAQQVQAVAQQHLHGNIFKADVNAAQTALAALPWVGKAQVKRIWPDTVVVSLTERVLVAHWDHQRLVDSNGELFSAETSEALPQFMAETTDAAARVPPLMVAKLASFQAALRPTGLQIAKLHYSARSAWTLELDNGITVRLGRENEAERLQHFVWAWPRVLQAQAADINYVDMRYKDGFALRRRGETAAAEASNAATTE